MALEKGLLELDHGIGCMGSAQRQSNGVPVLWIHGGPGSSARPMHRAYLILISFNHSILINGVVG